MSENSLNLGRVSLVPKGEYDPAAQYERLDLVRYNGAVYLARRDVSGVVPADGEDYMLLVEAGQEGPQGPPGEGADVDLSAYAPKDKPVFTGNISLDREDGSDVGRMSIALGNNIEASGAYSFAEGRGTKAQRWCGHVEGEYSYSNASYVSHAEGSGCIAAEDGTYLPVQSISGKTITIWKYLVDRINFQQENVLNDVVPGMTVYIWDYDIYHRCKGIVKRIVDSVDASAGTITVTENISVSNNITNIVIPMLPSYNVSVRKSGGHAEGYACVALCRSHAEGMFTIAQNISHAEGDSCKAFGSRSHAEGNSSITYGNDSHAEGSYTTASGIGSHAQNYRTTATANYQTAMGMYNVESADETDRLIVGKGIYGRAPANCFRVTDTGVYATGSHNSTGADYAEMFEWADGNLEAEDRAGRFVTLDGAKIRLAGPNDDYIIGIVSGDPSVVGDVHDDQWQGMYLYDIFGRPMWEDVEIPDVTDKDGHVIFPAHTEHRQQLNPDYDSSQSYQPRSERPEWDAVGMLGKLVAVDDGSCVANGWCTVGAEGIATKSDNRTKYRVMERLDKNHIRVLIL